MESDWIVHIRFRELGKRFGFHCRREFKRRMLREFKMRHIKASNFPRFRARYFAAAMVAVRLPRTDVAGDGLG